METTSIDVSADHLTIIKDEYEASARALNPTSRTTLARHLSAKTGLQYKTALQVVDVYCEQNGVPVPDYLSREFNVGWLKVVSVFTVIFAVGLCFYGRQLHLQQKNPTPIWAMAALVGGLAVLMWVKSLEAEVANTRVERDTKKA